MLQTREIIYDYKIRIEWGNEKKRSRRLRWALAMAAPVIVALLGGMASHQIRNHEFRLPPWGALFEREAPTPERLLRIPVASVTISTEGSPFLESVPQSPSAPVFAPASDVKKYPLDPPSPLRPPLVTFKQPGRSAGQALEGWRTVTVKRGDNLALIFNRLGLSRSDLDRIIGLGGTTAELERLNPDDNLRFRIRGTTLEEMVHELDLWHTLRVRNHDGAFIAETVAEELETRIVHGTGVIASSLFEAGQAAGLTDASIMNLAEIFGFDVDLVLDIREGDRFTVVYEEIYKDGEKVKEGNILAAEFVNQGKAYRAVRYQEDAEHVDYYRPDGESLRKAFIRTPVQFSRITSRFSLQRRHPVLNKIRAHKGVDYAAPTGTPVRATGDGQVTLAGWQEGYGRVVMLQHPGGYTTVYGHLSRFAKAIRQGGRVQQGEVIGYVGRSGLATGPHLHYEFRVNGVHRDPLKAALPNALPVSKEKLPDFKATTQTALAMLNQATGLADTEGAQTSQAPVDSASATAEAGPTVTAAVAR
ncbi:MAG: M23 family metallopeptidase [Chromatiales bacterium]